MGVPFPADRGWIRALPIGGPFGSVPGMNYPIPGGLLVAVEGIDGAGKTTVAALLAQWCGERGLACVFSKEPTSLSFGKVLRESAQAGRLSVEEEVELFRRDRQEHVRRSIGPALEAGAVVILDRYYWSTAAYQGARGVDFRKIVAENRAVAPVPDLVLFLDLDPAEGLSRIRRRGDVPNDFEELESLRAVGAIFQALAREPGERAVRIDAAADFREVYRAALAHFREAALEKIRQAPGLADRGERAALLE